MYKLNETELQELEKIKKRHFYLKKTSIIMITSIIIMITLICYYTYILYKNQLNDKAFGILTILLIITMPILSIVIHFSKEKIKEIKIITKAIKNNLYEVIPCKISELKVEKDEDFPFMFFDKIDIRLKIKPIENTSKNINTEYFYDIYSSKSNKKLNDFLQDNKNVELKMIVFNQELILLMLI